MSTAKDFITQYGILIKGSSAVTSSTGQTNALQVNGGAAIAKNLFVGTTADIYGNVQLYSDLNVLGYSYLSNTTATNLITNNLLVNQIGTLTNLVVTNDTNVKTLTATTSTFNGPVSVSNTNNFTVGTGETNLGGNLTVTGNVLFNNTSSATSDPAGSLVVMGGIYVDKNIIVSSLESSTSTNTDNALYVKGGAYIDNNLTVAGTTVFKDYVYFNGTATYVYSTNTYVTDNIIHLHTPADGIESEWTFDDGKDIGFIFQYFNTTGTTGALVLANDTKYLEWYESGVETTGTITAGIYGTFKTGKLILTDSSSATNSTGALTVAGGISVGDNAYITNNLTAGSLTGRDLTSGSVVVSGAGGILTNDPGLVYDFDNQILITIVTTATYANNLIGGATGSIPYQSSTDTTTFLSIGAIDAVLVSTGNIPEWRLLGEVATGYAVTATNIRYGTAGQVPYQVSTGTTSFFGPGNPGQILTSGGTSGPVYVNTGNIYVGRAIAADTIATTATSVDASYYLTFVDSNNATRADEVLYTDSGISYNPNTDLLTLSGDLAINGGDITSTAASFNLLNANVTTLNFVNSGTAITIGSTSGYTAINNLTTITNTTNATSTTTGALVVNGGAGFANDVYIGGNLTVIGDIYADIVGTITTATNLAGGSQYQIPYQTATGQTSFESGFEYNYSTNLFSVDNIQVNGTTDATSTITGALIVSGGAGIGKNIHVGGSVTAGETANSKVIPALYSNNVILASYTSPELTTTDPVNLDSYTASVYRTAKYTVQIFDDNKIHITEIMVSHNGSTAYLSEYGIITSDGELGLFDAVLSGGLITLTFTPSAVTSMTIKVVRFGITS